MIINNQQRNHNKSQRSKKNHVLKQPPNQRQQQQQQTMIMTNNNTNINNNSNNINNNYPMNNMMNMGMNMNMNGMNNVTQSKPTTFREGDWVCLRCNNLNFSFRFQCNRCNLQTKEQNEMMIKGQMIDWSIQQQPPQSNINIQLQYSQPQIQQQQQQQPQQQYLHFTHQTQSQFSILDKITPQKLFPKKISQESNSTNYSDKTSSFDEDDNYSNIQFQWKQINTSDKNSNMAVYEEEIFLMENQTDFDQQQISSFNSNQESEVIIPVRYSNNFLSASSDEFCCFEELMQVINEFPQQEC